jgi:hypothetical protein
MGFTVLRREKQIHVLLFARLRFIHAYHMYL